MSKKALTIKSSGRFQQKVTPKPVKTPADMFMFTCSKCGCAHFAHAGYVVTLMPFIRADKEENVSETNSRVILCVKCQAGYIWLNEQMHDITAMLEMDAWETLKMNRNMHPDNFDRKEK